MRKVAIAGTVLFVLLSAMVVSWNRYEVGPGALGGRNVTLRRDRFTNEMQVLTSSGWRKINGTGPTPAALPVKAKPPCTAEQLKAIDPRDPYADLMLTCEPPAPTQDIAATRP